MQTSQEGRPLRSRLCCPLASEGAKKHSSEDDNVNVLAREDRWLKEELNNPFMLTEVVVYGATYHTPSVQFGVPSPDSLTTIHPSSHLASAAHMRAGWVNPRVTLMTLELRAHTCS